MGEPKRREYSPDDIRCPKCHGKEGRRVSSGGGKVEIKCRKCKHLFVATV